jgi:hypothetical protein
LKKLAAILLICLFLFNLFGYQILYSYVQQQSDVTLEHNLDQNAYNENELITLTIPLSMPYQHNSDGFERFHGEITLNGNIYEYVKRKYCDGKIIFLCLPNHNKMYLEAEKNKIATNNNDIQTSGTKKQDNPKQASGKNISTDYQQNLQNYSITFYNGLRTPYSLNQVLNLPNALHNSPEQPPELA